MPSIRIGFSTDFNLTSEQVGIGTTFPTARLDVRGQILSDNSRGGGGVSTVTRYDGFLDSEQRVISNISIAQTTKGNLNSLSGEIVIENEVTVTGDTPLTGGRLDSLTVTGKFDLPQGGTEDREDTPEKGSTRFNQDLGQLEFYTGTEWRTTASYDGSGRGRGVFSSGDTPSGSSPSIEFVNIQSQGNSQYFGNTTQARTNAYGCSDGKRGVFGGGYSGGAVNTVDYITIASQGNAITFGTLSVTRNATASVSSSTRGLWCGGTLVPNSLSDTIDYVEIGTLGTALDFGNLATSRHFAFGCGDTTRGVVAGGASPAIIGGMEFFTISSKGDALDFGDLTQARRVAASCSNSVRGIFAGGGASPIFYNTIDYLTIASLGNAQDFGDASVQYENRCGVCDQTRALIGGGLNPGLSPTRINTIEFVTIASTGDAQDFGDLATQKRAAGGVSDSHGGLGGF